MKGAPALAVLTVCAAGLALPACRARHDRVGPDGVVAAAGSRRLVEPRLSGGFAYAPCRSVADPQALVPAPRCPELPNPERFARLANSIDKLAERHPSPNNLRAQALVKLVQPPEPAGAIGSERAGVRGGRRGWDRAVAELEQAIRQAPRDANLWSDLAAAHLLQAQRAGDAYELPAAIDAADRAVAVAPTLPEALFNRALIFEHLYLDGAARDAWERYLTVDAGSGWAEEARAHLQALHPPPVAGSGDDEEQRTQLAKIALAGGDVETSVRRSPRLAREAAERHLLCSWAERQLHGEGPAAARALAATRTVGKVLARTTGERFVFDTVTAIEAAQGDPHRLATLAEGHGAHCRGEALYHRRRLERAIAELTAARAALTRAGSPARFTADFFIASSDHMEGRRQEAAEAFERLASQLADRSYPSLSAHVDWMRGLSSAVLGHTMDSLGAYQRAAASFERIGEAANAGQMYSLLGESLERLGRHRQAWEQIYRGLRSARPPADPGARFLAYAAVVDSALQQGKTELALYFQNEAVAAAEQAREESLLPDSLYWRSLIEHRLGRSELAQEDARRAEERIAALEVSPLRRALEAGLAAIRAEASLAADPETAIASLSEAIEFYRQTEHRLLTLHAYQSRARAYLAVGDREHAETDLVAALGIYEELGRPREDADVVHEELRLSFLAETEEVFDQIVAFELESGHPRRAWAFADRARTRVLPANAVRDPDQAEHGNLLAVEPEPLPLAEVQRRLPPGTTLLEYSVLGDRVVVWRLRRESCDLFTTPVNPAELARLSTAVRRAGGTEAATAASTLFDDLLRLPLAGVAREESLVIVPDKVLNAVPFAILRGPDGRYLIEDHRVVVAPSATLYVRALAREQALAAAARGPARTLVLGDPAFDLTLYGDLKPLPGAAAEAERIAARDPQRSLLRLRKAADKASFLALAPEFEQIHLAAHAVVDARNPLLSALILAPSGNGDTGALYGKEIYTLRLPRTRLVVLAACDTGDAYVPGSEGATTLGRAFLAAGVPTVVASLWEVDDLATSRLLSRFHDELRAGVDPASALRRAQIALRKAPETAGLPAADWGAFEVFGGKSPGNDGQSKEGTPMTFTFRMRFSGLCVFVPEQPFESVGPDTAGSPGRVTVLLRDLLRPESLKAAGDGTLSDPHFPLLEFDRRNRRESSNRDADFTSHSSIYDGKSYCLLFGEDLNILPDGKEAMLGGVTTPPFVHDLGSSSPNRNLDSLAWVAQVADVSPARGRIDPKFLQDEPDAQRASEAALVWPGAPVPTNGSIPSAMPPTSIIARIQLAQGRLTTSRLSDVECTIFPNDENRPFKRRIAVELTLDIPGVEREVVIKMTRKNLGVPLGTRQLVLAPKTEDPTDNFVEVQVHNREIDSFIGIPLDYVERQPVADFEVYYRLSSALLKDDKLPTIRPLPPPLAPTTGSVPNGKCPPTAMMLTRSGGAFS